MTYHFQPMRAAFAREIVRWRYDGPYAVYNLDTGPDGAEGHVVALTDAANRYFAVLDGGETLVAFRCFGDDARVRGGDYADDALDTGGGLRPDLTGRGMGLSMLEAGLSFGEARYQPKAFRVTVATFNVRALRVCSRAGFGEVQRFQRPGDGVGFAVLTRGCA